MQCDSADNTSLFYIADFKACNALGSQYWAQSVSNPYFKQYSECDENWFSRCFRKI